MAAADVIGLVIEAMRNSASAVRAPSRDVCHAEGALIEHAPAIGGQRDHAWHVLALNRTAQRRVDARAPQRILRTRRAGGRSKHAPR